MNSKIEEKEILNHFGKRSFSSKELYNLYKTCEPELKESTFRWRVYALKKNKTISTVKRGVYVINYKGDFEPKINRKLINLYRQIKKQFPYTQIAIWETSWINEFLIHQVLSNNIILEVEKDASNAVFAYLQETEKNIFLNPKKIEVENYIIPRKNNIIIKNLTLTSPLIEREGIRVATLEKIIVDIFTDVDIFTTFQGKELKNIFENIFMEYNINQSRLSQYANKRHKKEDLVNFIIKKTGIDKKQILM